MSEELRDIMLSGFSIFPSNGKFIVKKQSLPHSDFSLEDKEFDNYGDAVSYASNVLKKPRKKLWDAIVRYNRGLGIEYRNILNIESETFEQAIDLATTQADAILSQEKAIIHEIKVRPK